PLSLSRFVLRTFFSTVSPIFPIFFFSLTRRPPRSTPLSLHDALPISARISVRGRVSGLEDAIPDEQLEDHIVTWPMRMPKRARRSEEHTSELQSLTNLVCRLLLEKKKRTQNTHTHHSHTRARTREMPV